MTALHVAILVFPLAFLACAIVLDLVLPEARR